MRINHLENAVKLPPCKPTTPGKRGLILPAIALLLAGAAHPALQAQEATDRPRAPIAAPDDSTELETIVVTAQKRSENIIDVPYSISAVSGALLEQQHIVNVEDLTMATAGVSFGAGANPGMDTVTIRGVSSQGGGATVGLYLDDAPITTTNPFNPSYSGATEPTLLDINRIEVLRGPQGTLYGAGSMGGTIRYIYNQPDYSGFSTTAGTDLSGTRHGGFNDQVRGVVNLPLVDGVLALRAAVEYSHESGYIDHFTYIPPTQASLNAGGDDGHAGVQDQSGVNSYHTLTTRASLAYKPNDDLQIVAAFHYQQRNANDTSLWYESVGLYQQDKLYAEPSTDSLFVPSLTITKQFSMGELTSVTSYFRRVNDHHSDGTYFNSDFIEYLADFYYPDTAPCNCGAKFDALPGPSITQQVTQTATQEFRFASKLPVETGLPISWIGGLFLSDHKITVADDEYVTGLRSMFISLYNELPENSGFADPFTNDSVFTARAHETEKQYAAFGEFSYYFTSALKATAGLRYMIAKTDYVYDEGGYFAQGIPPVVALDNDYHASTPKLSLDYKVNDEVAIYADMAKGYRLGGYIQPIQTTVGLCVADLQALGLANPGFSYNSDQLWSYELGAKSNLLGNTLSVNASGYYIRWNNIQQTFDLSCGSPYTANFGTAESYGGELEVRAKPITNLTLGLNAGVNHAFLTAVNPNVGATAGQNLLNTPKWTLNLNADYSWHMTDAVKAFARADFSRVGTSYGSYIVSAVNFENPGYTLVNASVGATVGMLDMSLYAKNLLDNHQAIQHVSIEQTVSAYSPRPLTVGVSLTAHF